MPSIAALTSWLALEPEALLRRCDQTPFQGPGPGGQKRNRVYSGVRLRHAESGLSAEASERREARRNLADALHRLRLAMALALPVSVADSSGPMSSEAVTTDSRLTGAGSVESGSSGAVSAGTGSTGTGDSGSESSGAAPLPPVPGGIAFRPGAKASHADYPRLAFAALLALDLRRGRLAEAAAGLGCSASALARFLAADKRVWARAQEIRKRNGLHALKPG